MEKTTTLEDPVRSMPRALAPSRLSAPLGGSRVCFAGGYVEWRISQRARGLTLAVSLNPNQVCNFNCAYCGAWRTTGHWDRRVNVPVLAAGLRRALRQAGNGRIQGVAGNAAVPEDLLQVREIHLSGNGEPTLCPNFAEAVETVVYLRAAGNLPYYKLVLVTNGTGLQRPEVQKGLAHFVATDEIWIKLDAGSQARMDLVNRANYPLSHVLENILTLGKQRPVIIQSLFPIIHDQEPTPQDIEDYVQRLAELKRGGAQIALAQVYSAQTPPSMAGCGHLPLKTLGRIARRIREATGLAAEVF